MNLRLINVRRPARYSGAGVSGLPGIQGVYTQRRVKGKQVIDYKGPDQRKAEM